MDLTYCEKCGNLITEKDPKPRAKSKETLCDDCRQGTSRKRRRQRDSDSIPKAKLETAMKMGRGKKPGR